MIQLPAGASDSIPGQGRDFGRGWRPGGVPGIQIRHSPSSGRCPGGTPNVAAVLGPRFVSASRTSGLGPRTTVLVERVQAPAASRPARPDTSTTLRIRPPHEKVGPNVVFPVVSVGDLYEQVERALYDEPILVGRKRGGLGTENRRAGA